MGGMRHQHSGLLPLVRSVNSSFCCNGTTNESLNSTNGLSSAPLMVHRISLIIIYTLVLMVGVVGVSLMINVLKSNMHSWTTIIFFNLVLVHVIFLATIPFRIYYYVTGCWELTMVFCRLVSSMIHIHMHVVFVIYIILLTIHYLHYFKRIEQMEFYRRFHAFAFSIGIWSVVIIVGPLILINYGKSTQVNDGKCFHFGTEIDNTPVFVCNVVLSVCTIIVSCIMSSVLAVILYTMIQKHGASSWAQQEFWAQMKNISLVFIILFCLAPYHLYRLYYLSHTKEENNTNEVFLAITSLTCFDMMLVFAGKGICQRCGY